MTTTTNQSCVTCGTTLPKHPTLVKRHLEACGVVVPDTKPEYEYEASVDTARFNTQEQAPVTAGDSEQPAWSKYGQYLLDAALRIRPRPLLLIGESGTGKTYLAKYLAKTTGQGFLAINCSEQMAMDTLVGIPAPANSAQGIYLQWVDGMLTQAARDGLVFLMEEMTRAPDEIRSSLYGLLDQVNRYWSTPQAGGIAEPVVPVHEDFWFIGTANPPGGPYATYQLDPAMDSRLAVQFRVNQPLADERVVLLRRVTQESVLIKPAWDAPASQMSKGDLVGRLLKVAHDARPPEDERHDFLLPHEEARPRCLNTRDLITMLDALLLGFSPPEVAGMFVHGYGDLDNGIKMSLVTHFGVGSW